VATTVFAKGQSFDSRVEYMYINKSRGDLYNQGGTHPWAPDTRYVTITTFVYKDEVNK
jgi:hypothetical protein